MCYVIVTSRTLLWTLLTIASALAMLAAVVSPYWLYGAPRMVTTRNRLSTSQRASSAPTISTSIYEEGLQDFIQRPIVHDHTLSGGREAYFYPTVGIFNRCTRIQHAHNDFHNYNCAPFVSSLSMPTDEFPGFWKASLCFFTIGLLLMTLTAVTSVIGCCIRAIKRKSIFTISGTVQAVAGLFYILGLVLYPAGWGSRRISLLCGVDADYYMLGGCSFGWAFYLAIGSTMSTFVCSVLSVQAEISTSSDKVQDEIFEGKNLICLL